MSALVAMDAIHPLKIVPQGPAHRFPVLVRVWVGDSFSEQAKRMQTALLAYRVPAESVRPVAHPSSASSVSLLDASPAHGPSDVPPFAMTEAFEGSSLCSSPANEARFGSSGLQTPGCEGQEQRRPSTISARWASITPLLQGQASTSSIVPGDLRVEAASGNGAGLARTLISRLVWQTENAHAALVIRNNHAKL